MNKESQFADTLSNEFDCKQGAVRAVRFNVDGNYCLTCGSDKSLKLWNPYKGTLVNEYQGHGYEVLDADAAADNANLCSASMDRSVIYWDVAKGKILRKYREHAAQVNTCRFNEEGSIIISGSVDGTVRAWDCRSRSTLPIQTLSEAKDSVTCVQVLQHEILSGCVDGCVRRYDLRMGQLFTDKIGPPVTSIQLTMDGQCILASTLDSKLRLIDKLTGQLLNEYSGHKNSNYTIDACISSSDTHIYSGSEDACVYVWSLIDAKISKKLQPPMPENKSVVHSLSHHCKKATLLIAAGNKVTLWNTGAVTMTTEK